MAKIRDLFIEGIGSFVIPAEPEVRSIDSEKTVQGICGRIDVEVARREGAWGNRVGQEYSYLGRIHVEDVKTIIDVGCNVGSYFVWACRYWWPDTVREVYAYDPGSEIISCAYENRGLVQRGIYIQLNNLAVTIDPAPIFREDVRSGCSRTFVGTTADGIESNAIVPHHAPVAVPAVHPSKLPPCDAFKCDAEGVEGEIIEHYPHWAGVKVLQLEWHEHAHRKAAYALAEREGLRLMKNDCGVSQQGVGCWVRP